MSLRTSASNLHQAAKQLLAEWHRTEESWHDPQSQAFQENYLEELPHAVSRATTVIEELEHLLRKVRSDCE